MKTFNRLFTVFARLKLRKGNYVRRISFIALTSILLISFQNCSQGKFEIDEAQFNAASQNDTINASGDSAGDGTTPPPPPPVIIETPTGPVGPTQAQIDAEVARKLRCKSAIVQPVITNTADFSNKVLLVKSGLGLDAGDVNIPNTPSRPIAVNIGANQGIDASKVSVADACSFRTSVVEEVSSDAGMLSDFISGIDVNGDPVTTADVDGQRDSNRMQQVLQRNTSGNNNNGLAFTMGTPTLGINYMIRQTNNNVMRTIRCAQGTIIYKYKVRVETQGLNNNTAPFTTGTNVADASMETGYVFARVDVENNCWKEMNLTKTLSPADTPAANSLLGTAVAAEGEWAASVSNKEGGTGYLYLFRKVNGNWVSFQKLKGPNGNNTGLTGVSIKNGLLALASSGDGNGYKGKVFLYALSGSLLTTPLQTIVNPSADFSTKFGSAVAVTPSGVAIGDSVGVGKVYLYNANAGQYGNAGNPSATIDGSSIDSAILGFGKTIVCQSGKLLVAAYEGNASYAGSVHIFDVAGGTFASRISFTPPVANVTPNGLFGSSMAFNGTSLAIGAYENSLGGNNVAGALFYYSDYTSSNAPHVIQGSQAEERFGVSVGFSGDSLYVGSRGGTGSSGTVNRYKVSDLNANSNYNSKVFVQRSHTAINGEGFSHAISILSGTAVPTLFVSAQTKEFNGGIGDIRSKAGAVLMYEVK